MHSTILHQLNIPLHSVSLARASRPIYKDVAVLTLEEWIAQLLATLHEYLCLVRAVVIDVMKWIILYSAILLEVGIREQSKRAFRHLNDRVILRLNLPLELGPHSRWHLDQDLFLKRQRWNKIGVPSYSSCDDVRGSLYHKWIWVSESWICLTLAAAFFYIQH